MRRKISFVLGVIGTLFGSTLAPRRSIPFWNSAGTGSCAPDKQFGVFDGWRDRHTRPARWSDTLQIRPVRQKWNQILIESLESGKTGRPYESEVRPWIPRTHDDIITRKHFPVTGDFPGQRPATLSLICAWIQGWVNNGAAVDLIRHRAHQDVIEIPLLLIQMPPILFSRYKTLAWSFMRRYHISYTCCWKFDTIARSVDIP